MRVSSLMLNMVSVGVSTLTVPFAFTVPYRLFDASTVPYKRGCNRKAVGRWRQHIKNLFLITEATKFTVLPVRFPPPSSFNRRHAGLDILEYIVTDEGFYIRGRYSLSELHPQDF